uniref:Uncharacterized protein n=1 Tax=Arundo donax TaxID=35708 RepID=A0A0A9C152_ARUDO
MMAEHRVRCQQNRRCLV